MAVGSPRVLGAVVAAAWVVLILYGLRQQSVFNDTQRNARARGKEGGQRHVC